MRLASVSLCGGAAQGCLDHERAGSLGSRGRARPCRAHGAQAKMSACSCIHERLRRAASDPRPRVGDFFFFFFFFFLQLDRDRASLEAVSTIIPPRVVFFYRGRVAVREQSSKMAETPGSPATTCSTYQWTCASRWSSFAIRLTRNRKGETVMQNLCNDQSRIRKNGPRIGTVAHER